MAQLSQPITYRTLLAFAVPMIVSQLFMNVNFIVDGFFVAHAVGTDGLSAINIVMPFIPLTIVLATMLGTGGSALIAAQLGAGENRHARENFSLLVLICVILSTMIAALGMTFLRPTLRLGHTRLSPRLPAPPAVHLRRGRCIHGNACRGLPRRIAHLPAHLAEAEAIRISVERPGLTRIKAGLVAQLYPKDLLKPQYIYTIIK